MTWEETIIAIRQDPAFADIVRDAYFDENLTVNVEMFRNSDEFKETLRILKENCFAQNLSLVDIGSGNGIAAVAFALEGFNVLAVEPDPGNSIGAGAIRKLKDIYKLQNLEVKELFAEDLSEINRSYDIVYVRQALHHAKDLNLFVSAAVGLLKPKGVFMAVREHVIYDKEDKEYFLSSHPLHKFYGGENAFTLEEYENAFQLAGLRQLKRFGHFANVINYAPLSGNELVMMKENEMNVYKSHLSQKLPVIGKTALAWFVYKMIKGLKTNAFPSEKKIAGRLYSFIYQK